MVLRKNVRETVRLALDNPKLRKWICIERMKSSGPWVPRYSVVIRGLRMGCTVQFSCTAQFTPGNDLDQRPRLHRSRMLFPTILTPTTLWTRQCCCFTQSDAFLLRTWSTTVQLGSKSLHSMACYSDGVSLLISVQ